MACGQALGAEASGERPVQRYRCSLVEQGGLQPDLEACDAKKRMLAELVVSHKERETAVALGTCRGVSPAVGYFGVQYWALQALPDIRQTHDTASIQVALQTVTGAAMSVCQTKRSG